MPRHTRKAREMAALPARAIPAVARILTPAQVLSTDTGELWLPGLRPPVPAR